MISRRQAIAGLAAAGCGCASGPLRAQWPNGAKAGATNSAKVPVGGCGLDQAAARLFARQYRLRDWLEDDSKLQDFFISCYHLSEDWFEVKPSFGFYDDGGNMNAFATPFRLFGTAEPHGTVVFGDALMANQLRRGTAAGSGMLTIVAHEYAHIRQFHEERGGRCPATELEADYLAGWMLGREYYRPRLRLPALNLAAAADTLFRFGSYDFNTPGFHGTPEQRRDALLAGMALGRRGADLSDAYALASSAVSPAAD